MTLGLFGGTFDPPHIGHLIVAQDAAEALALDRVLFVPAGDPPHKRDQAITPAPLRVAMLRAAVEGAGRFEVDDRETRRQGPSYTVDTLAGLREERPDDRLFLMVGSDQYAVFDTWRDVARIRTLCTVVVLDRDGGPGPVQAGDIRLRVPRIDVSASDIRARSAEGRSIRYLVTDPVAELIRAHGLYGVGEPDRRTSGAREDRNEIAGSG